MPRRAHVALFLVLEEVEKVPTVHYLDESFVGQMVDAEARIIWPSDAQISVLVTLGIV